LLSVLLWKDVHPPLYTLLLFAWTSLFGNDEITVRLPSLVCGLGSLGLLWLMARRWLGPRRGLLAAGLLALSPPHIWYSREAKVNMLALLLTTAATWLYWRAVERRRCGDWIAASLVLIASMYTHAYAVPVGLAIFLWLCFRAWGDSGLVRPLIKSGALVALVVAPLALTKFLQISALHRGYLRQFSPVEAYTLLLVWLPSGNTLRTIDPLAPFSRLVAQPLPFFLLDACFAFILARGLVRAFGAVRGDGGTAPSANASTTQSARLILLWFIVPLLFTMAGSLWNPHFYIERNLLVVLPPYLLLLVMGADQGTGRWTRAPMAGVVLVLAVAATASLLFLKTEVWTVHRFKPDWRALARHFNTEIKANGTLRVLTTTLTNEFRYYGPRIVLRDTRPGSKGRLAVENGCRGKPQEAADAVERKNWGTFHLLHNTTWRGCWDRVWRAFSNDPRFKLIARRSFKGLVVYKFARRSPDQTLHSDAP
jgi:uncharacterized membrane protein